jgi:hypothetical protein
MYTRIIFLVAVASLLSTEASDAQTLSGFTTKSPEELSQEGRLVVGRGVDYQPSTEDERLFSSRLKNSMLERRKFAWHVVEQMLQPTKVKLPEGDATIDVPRWQTWYEGGRLLDAQATHELPNLTLLYVKKLKANPDADRAKLADDTLNDQTKLNRSLAPALSDQRFTAVLEQFKNVPGLPAEFVERGSTAFSPSFVVHMLTNAEAIEKCERNMTAGQAPPSDTDFSNCIPEFPRSAVMVKTSWVELQQGVPQHDTGAAAMAKVIKEGTWPSTPTESIKHPSRDQIYTNVSKEGTEYALKSIHFSTKDLREWVWVTLWWDPAPRRDFGADMPDTIKSYNGGVWQNYKMCIVSAFDEGDPEPWIHYSGAQQSLGDSIKATYEAIEKQIREGGKQVPFFERFDAKSLGPWETPYDRPTEWCSNPNIETHPANGRTSCIGCHQGSFTNNDARIDSDDKEMQFWQIMAGDVPQFGRSQYRRNFPADFAWSFGFEFQSNIAEARRQIGFNWP